jgi:hypothetical protein
MACHDGRSASNQTEFFAGLHSGIACEDCHGPGQAHVRAGGRNGLLIANPGRHPFGDGANVCAKCHEDVTEGHKQTAHFQSRAAACVDCHNVHKEGGMVFSTPNNTFLDNQGYVQLCGECHERQTEEFLASTHAMSDVATCGACHNMHVDDTFTAPVADNQLCQQCHASFFLGLDSEEAVDIHTGMFHPVDPAGSGASNCVECHMPPARRTNQDDGPHDHTLFTIPPAQSNEMIAAGLAPHPNSCSGIMGCHDADVPGSGAPFDLDSIDDNAALQEAYEGIGEIPEGKQ